MNDRDTSDPIYRDYYRFGKTLKQLLQCLDDESKSLVEKEARKQFEWLKEQLVFYSFGFPGDYENHVPNPSVSYLKQENTRLDGHTCGILSSSAIMPLRLIRNTAERASHGPLSAAEPQKPTNTVSCKPEGIIQPAAPANGPIRPSSSTLAPATLSAQLLRRNQSLGQLQTKQFTLSREKHINFALRPYNVTPLMRIAERFHVAFTSTLIEHQYLYTCRGSQENIAEAMRAVASWSLSTQ